MVYKQKDKSIIVLGGVTENETALGSDESAAGACTMSVKKEKQGAPSASAQSEHRGKTAVRLNHMFCYSVESKKWTKLRPVTRAAILPDPRSEHVVVYRHDTDSLIIYGGVKQVAGDESLILDSMFEFRFDTSQWHRVFGVPSKKDHDTSS